MVRRGGFRSGAGLVMLGLASASCATILGIHDVIQDVDDGSGGSGGAGSSASMIEAASVSSVSAEAGASGTSSSNGASASSSSGVPCPLDEDQDGEISALCPGGTDCADHDFLAHREPPPVDFQPGPIQGATTPGTPPFDFNCDGLEAAEVPALNCPGRVACASGPGFESAVACGNAGAVGQCVSFSGLCKWVAESPPKNKVQRCK